MAPAPTPPENTYYDSIYLADYYESLWIDHPALSEDANFYWKHMKQALSQPTTCNSQNSPFWVLDVGTGTGRIIRTLSKRYKEEQESLVAPLRVGGGGRTVKFIGIDPSPFMLHEAQKATQQQQQQQQKESSSSPPSSSTIPPTISWLQGSAQTLTTHPPLPSLLNHFHLIIFSFSGINHLTTPRSSIKTFFHEAQNLLREDGNGTLLISICIPLLDKSHAIQEEHPYGQVKEVESKSFPGVVYREWEMGHYVMEDVDGGDGELYMNSLVTEAVRMMPDGREVVVERNEHRVPLRLLNREGLEDAIKGTTLRIEGEEWLHDQVIFVIRKVKKA